MAALYFPTIGTDPLSVPHPRGSSSAPVSARAHTHPFRSARFQTAALGCACRDAQTEGIQDGKHRLDGRSGECPQAASRVSIPIVREKPSRELLVEGGKHANAARSRFRSPIARGCMLACWRSKGGVCIRGLVSRLRSWLCP